MLKIAIVDDERHFLEEVKKILSLISKEEGISFEMDFFQSGVKFLSDFKSSEYDAVFLDVDMPKFSGIDIARSIREKNSNIPIIFITQFISFALEGYKVNATRYILKDEKLKESLGESIAHLLREKREMVFPLTDGEKRIFLADLIYIESDLHYLNLYTKNGIYTMRGKLDDLEDKLKEVFFLRIHQSYLVNLNFVKSMDDSSMKLSIGIKVPISRSRYQDVRSSFFKFKGDIIWNGK